MIRAVISDLGRVLLWFDNDVFLRRLAERAGRPFEEVKAAVHGDLRLIRRFDGGVLTPTGFYEHVITLVGADMNYEEFFGMYSECVFIDDIEENVRGAEAVGMAGVHYRPQSDLEAELEELGLRS
jgi:FMN phosphatase YigB (HAD superfamily)